MTINASMFGVGIEPLTYESEIQSTNRYATNPKGKKTKWEKLFSQSSTVYVYGLTVTA